MAANSSRLGHARSGGRPPASGLNVMPAVGGHLLQPGEHLVGRADDVLRRRLEVVDRLRRSRPASSAGRASGTTRTSAPRRARTGRSRPTPSPGRRRRARTSGRPAAARSRRSKPIFFASSKYASRTDGVGVHREHREPQARRAPRGGGHSPADEQHAARIGDRLRRDAHVAAAPLERLTASAPRSTASHVLLEDATARRVLEAGHLELLDAVARAERRSTCGRERVVEHRDLFGDRGSGRAAAGSTALIMTPRPLGAGQHRGRRSSAARASSRRRRRGAPTARASRSRARRPTRTARARPRRSRCDDAGPNAGARKSCRMERKAIGPSARELRAGEVRTDLGAERRDLVALLARRRARAAAPADATRRSRRAAVGEVDDAICGEPCSTPFGNSHVGSPTCATRW